MKFKIKEKMIGSVPSLLFSSLSEYLNHVIVSHSISYSSNSPQSATSPSSTGGNAPIAQNEIQKKKRNRFSIHAATSNIQPLSAAVSASSIKKMASRKRLMILFRNGIVFCTIPGLKYLINTTNFPLNFPPSTPLKYHSSVYFSSCMINLFSMKKSVAVTLSTSSGDLHTLQFSSDDDTNHWYSLLQPLIKSARFLPAPSNPAPSPPSSSSSPSSPSPPSPSIQSSETKDDSTSNLTLEQDTYYDKSLIDLMEITKQLNDNLSDPSLLHQVSLSSNNNDNSEIQISTSAKENYVASLQLENGTSYDVTHENDSSYENNNGDSNDTIGNNNNVDINFVINEKNENNSDNNDTENNTSITSNSGDNNDSNTNSPQTSEEKIIRTKKNCKVVIANTRMTSFFSRNTSLSELNSANISSSQLYADQPSLSGDLSLPSSSSCQNMLLSQENAEISVDQTTEKKELALNIDNSQFVVTSPIDFINIEYISDTAIEDTEIDAKGGDENVGDDDDDSYVFIGGNDKKNTETDNQIIDLTQEDDINDVKKICSESENDTYLLMNKSDTSQTPTTDTSCSDPENALKTNNTNVVDDGNDNNEAKNIQSSTGTIFINLENENKRISISYGEISLGNDDDFSGSSSGNEDEGLNPRLKTSSQNSKYKSYHFGQTSSAPSSPSSSPKHSLSSKKEFVGLNYRQLRGPLIGSKRVIHIAQQFEESFSHSANNNNNNDSDKGVDDTSSPSAKEDNSSQIV